MTDTLTLPEAAIESFEDEVAGIEALDEDLFKLSGAIDAIGAYGFNPSTCGVLQASGLFQDTALADIALEGFTFDNPTGPESTLAIETLREKLDDTAGKWSAKVLNLFHSSGEKIAAIVNPILNKVSSVTAKLAKQSWETTKSIGRTVKTHPFATILLILAAITAAVGIVHFAGEGLPKIGSSKAAAQSFMTSLRDRINTNLRNPFGKATATLEPIRGDATPLKLSVNWTKADAYTSLSEMNPIEASHIEKYGWSRNAATVLDRQITALKHNFDGAVHGFTKGISKVASDVGSAAARGVASAGKRYTDIAFTKIPNAVSNAVGGSYQQREIARGAATGAMGGITYLLFLYAVIGIIVLVKKIINYGLHLIGQCANAVLNLFSSPQTAQ